MTTTQADIKSRYCLSHDEVHPRFKETLKNDQFHGELFIEVYTSALSPVLVEVLRTPLATHFEIVSLDTIFTTR